MVTTSGVYCRQSNSQSGQIRGTCLSVRKKELYGTNRNDCEIVARASEDKRVRNVDDREPVFYHEQDEYYWRTKFDDHNVGRFCNFSLGSAVSLKVAVERNMPCCGMALTSTHKAHAERHLDHMIFKSMATEGSNIYEAQLAQLLGTSLATLKPNSNVEETTPKKATMPSKSKGSPVGGAVGCAVNRTANRPKSKAKSKAEAKSVADPKKKPDKEDLMSLIGALKKEKAVGGEEDEEDDEDDEDEEDEEEGDE